MGLPFPFVTNTVFSVLLLTLFATGPVDSFLLGSRRDIISSINRGKLSLDFGLTSPASLYTFESKHKFRLSFKDVEDNDERETETSNLEEEDMTTEIQFANEEEAVNLLMQAVEKSNNVDPVYVEQALLYLERLERKARKVSTSKNIDLEAKMIGAWRLIFTTGTKETQKKLYWGARIFSNKGKRVKLNYFPVKAVQYFGEDNDYRNTALYFSNKPDSKALVNVIGKFYTPSKTKMPKLELDVQKVNIGGLFEFKTEGKGYFTMFYVDDNICCARGQGGGLAVWTKQK